MKHLLKMSDLSKAEIIDILNLADQLKYELKHNIPHRHLEGKTLGMIFQKSSTRTRVSFETGMYQLGGNALFLSSRDLQIGRGEPVQDTARVLSRYLNGIMIRTFEQKEVEDLADFGNIPIINGLTDYCHPCQVLADLMTIREYKGQFDGLKMCYIGDGNNMANSLIVGGLTVGMDVAVACPEGYRPDASVLDFAKNYEGKFTLTDKPLEAAANADVLFTDVWASMGQEGEAEIRKKAFEGYQINDEVMAAAKRDAMVQHCLPAHREEEITAKVFEAHAEEIFEEAENRLHAQKAVMVKLMKS
ncbi:MAG: ornithine carbamoyltransferase [Oscillospiraceae bacterium]|nr:ornithine carbamoyltransferase [Oscillospiraceae bacterium]